MTLAPIDWLLMFVYFGFVLGVGFALKRSLGISVDLIWGGVLLVFGLAFLIGGTRGRKIGLGAETPEPKA